MTKSELLSPSALTTLRTMRYLPGISEAFNENLAESGINKGFS